MGYTPVIPAPGGLFSLPGQFELQRPCLKKKAPSQGQREENQQDQTGFNK